ncbi:MAG: outer membrane protein [Roseiarcus sp.]
MNTFTATTSAAAVLISIGSAVAADLPTTKSPPPPQVVAAVGPLWSGFYGGLDAGYDWGRSVNGMAISSTTLAAFPPVLDAVEGAGSRPMTESGAALGGQIGYAFQATPLLVAGLEADADWSGERGSLNQAPPLPVFGGAFTLNQSLSADWTASLRARLGVTPIRNLLFYGLGGVAVAGLHYASAFDDPFNEAESIDRSATKAGWIAGLGVEYALDAHWSARLEYTHSDFGPVTGTGVDTLVDQSQAYVFHTSGHLQDDAVRIGVNYWLGN